MSLTGLSGARRWPVAQGTVLATAGVFVGVIAWMWRTGLTVLSTRLAAAGAPPQIRQMISGIAKPRIVTWGTWALLTGVSRSLRPASATWRAAVFAAADPDPARSSSSWALRYGDRTLSALDTACLVLARTGVVPWQSLAQPAIAVLIACFIDAVGLVPTIVHVWHRLREEITSAYPLIAAGGLTATLAARGDWTITALAYPAYVAVSMGAVALMTLRRVSEVTPPAALLAVGASGTPAP